MLLLTSLQLSLISGLYYEDILWVCQLEYHLFKASCEVEGREGSVVADHPPGVNHIRYLFYEDKGQ